MADKYTTMLVESVLAYRDWIRSLAEHRGRPSNLTYTQTLVDFILYVIRKDVAHKDVFTLDTVEAFKADSGHKGAYRAIKALSEYLYTQGRIDQPLQIPKPDTPLPDLYEHYLRYLKHSRPISSGNLSQVKRLLYLLHKYLLREQIEVSDLKIEHLDEFVAEFKVADNTMRVYRYDLRGFLTYLYHERKIIKKDLGSLLVNPRWIQRSKPPKFLRPHELKKLFGSLELSTPSDIRNYAMVNLAYFLGLRPVEISRITFDDISFAKAELTLRRRKADNPMTLPVPENVIKAIAAYVLKARPKTDNRHVFLSFHFPYGPMKSGSVVTHLSIVMKKAGLDCSGYSLRHTYAQNLLESGRSFYEIKEMLGHDKIDSTGVYLHIHTDLMRKVLFNEPL